MHEYQLASTQLVEFGIELFGFENPYSGGSLLQNTEPKLRVSYFRVFELFRVAPCKLFNEKCF